MSTVKGKFNKLLVADCETSGLVFACDSNDPSQHPETKKTYQSVSWGLLVVDADTLKPIDELYVEIKYNGTSEWNMKAEQVHGLTKEYLEQNGVSEEEAAIEIGNFIFEHFGTSMVVCGGHNFGSFDIWFMRRLMNQFGIMFNISNRIIDTNSIGYVCYNTFTSDQLFDLMGVKRTEHNSLEDAKASLKILYNTRQLMDTITG